MTDFGIDLSCVTDIASDGRTVDGKMLVAEALARRLSTPHGRLIADPDYGFDLTGYLNDDMSPADIAAMVSGAENECLKDERVTSATVEAVLGSDSVMTVTVSFECGEGPFDLVLSVTDTTVAILEVT